MLSEFSAELLKELILELSKMKECVVVVDEEGYKISEDRIKHLVKVLKEQ